MRIVGMKNVGTKIDLVSKIGKGLSTIKIIRWCQKDFHHIFLLFYSFSLKTL